MGRPVKRIQADADTLKELHRRAKAATSTVREKERATIVLLRLDGKGVEAVAEQLRTTAKRVSVWSKRFDEKGLGGLEDKPGRGRRASIPEAKVAQVITEVTRPPESRKRWSARSLDCRLRRSGLAR